MAAGGPTPDAELGDVVLSQDVSHSVYGFLLWEWVDGRGALGGRDGVGEDPGVETAVVEPAGGDGPFLFRGKKPIAPAGEDEDADVVGAGRGVKLEGHFANFQFRIVL